MRKWMGLGVVFLLGGCDAAVKVVDLSMKATDLAIAGVSAASREYGYPYTVVTPLPSDAFVGERCNVRVEPLVFDANTSWDGKRAAEYFDAQQPAARANAERDRDAAIASYAKQIDKGESKLVGRLGRVATKAEGKEAFVVRGFVEEVKTVAGVLSVRHEVLSVSDGKPVAAFTVNAGTRTLERPWTKSSGQAAGLAVLSYLGDRFACKSSPRVSDQAK